MIPNRHRDNIVHCQKCTNENVDEKSNCCICNFEILNYFLPRPYIQDAGLKSAPSSFLQKIGRENTTISRPGMEERTREQNATSVNSHLMCVPLPVRDLPYWLLRRVAYPPRRDIGVPHPPLLSTLVLLSLSSGLCLTLPPSTGAALLRLPQEQASRIAIGEPMGRRLERER